VTPRRSIAGALIVCLTSLLIGCGSDGSSTTTDGFEIDVPGVSTVPADPVPGVGGQPDPSQPDSETNDLPPEPGSPQDTFEKFCRENPEACG